MSLSAQIPSEAEVLNERGIAEARRGRLQAAIELYRQALAITPDFSDAINNLGIALAQLGRASEAVEMFGRAIAVRPSYAEAHNNLGIALAQLRRFEDARGSFETALALKPDYAEAHNNLGNVLRSLKLHDLALEHYDRAVANKPDYAEAYSNRGNTLTDLDRAAEAVESFQASLRLNPSNAEAYNNLGTAHARLEDLDQAIECYSKAAGLRKDYADAYFNRSVIRLQKGDFANGWAEYEWRWWTNGLKPRTYSAPPWNGESLRGKTILVYTEQGAGDSFQFIRFIPLLKRLGAEVVLECATDFSRILATCPGVDQIVPPGGLPARFDYHCAMLSLPRLLSASLESIPREVPYLKPDPQLAEAWRVRFGAEPGLKVGIHWQGNPQYKGDRWRSIPLEKFAPLAKIPGVRLVSLQKNHGIDQIDAQRSRFEFAEIGRDLDQETGAFVETAAVLANLDLLITSDTAIAHLAGALNAPVWMPLSRICDWRWLEEREDSPWYPSMRIFRQKTVGDWDEVFSRIAHELKRLIAKRTQCRSVSIPISPGELIDRITILEIKAERIADAAKLANIRAELFALEQARGRSIVADAALDADTAELKGVNQRLWEVEDDLRRLEKKGDFGPTFVELARLVYKTNDRRALIKRAINERLGSEYREEKSYKE